MAAVISSFSSWLYKGPRRKEWPLKYQLGLDMIRSFLIASEEEPHDFIRVHKEALEIKPKNVKGIKVTEIFLSPDIEAVKFLKTKVNPSAWPNNRADQTDSQLLCEWLEPDGAPEDKAILHFHGGGYISLSSKTHRGILNHIALKAKIKIFTVNYRLAPFDPYPCAVIDALSAYLFLLESGYDPSKIAIFGDSAAGGLALATALALKDWGKQLPACIYCQSPWVDLSHQIGIESLVKNTLTDYVKEQPRDPRRGTNEIRIQYYAPNEILQDPYVSPFFGDFQGMPPMLIQVGTAERLYDEIALLTKKIAVSAGSKVILEEYSGLMHVFQMFPFIAKAAYIALDRGAEFMRLGLSSTSSINGKTIMFDFNGIMEGEKLY